MKTLLSLTFTLLVSIFSVHGQSYNIPSDYKFVIEDDYKTYEPQVKETMGWILSTHIGDDARMRKKANEFVLQWAMGSPDVTIDLRPNIVNFMNDSPELLMPFIIGWARYSIDNNYSKDKVKGSVAGIETVVDFYTRNEGFVRKDKNVEKYKEMIEKGKLEKDIQKKIKKSL